MTEILVVADEPWVANDVRAALADHRYSITNVSDPRRAVDHLATNAVDVVLVDMQVGSMGGMAVARSVRGTTREGTVAPPVIILIDRDADSFLAKRAGAADWVRKPFGSSELRRAIDGAISVGAS
jgi:two-component system, OmpR family, KDP operon response regulator KdpE